MILISRTSIQAKSAITLAIAALALTVQPATSLAISDRKVKSDVCALSGADQAWLDRAVAAWLQTSREITHIRLPPTFDAIIFDADCSLVSRSLLASGQGQWAPTRHDGKVRLPNGEQIPASVISFAASERDIGFFAMSTPSVWRPGGVDGGPLGLETLMVAVLLHEGTHVAQIPTYGKRMERLSARHNLPPSFSDDSIQEQFAGNWRFSTTVRIEIDLFLRAAAASDEREAFCLARAARGEMIGRQARWFVGKDEFLRDAEDIWLTMEGSGQWAAYRWLIHPNGGQVAEAVALPEFGLRGNYWSQKLGFALFMALDRLAGASWKKHAFGDGARTALEMLDEVLAEKAASQPSCRTPIN